MFFYSSELFKFMMMLEVFSPQLERKMFRNIQKCCLQFTQISGPHGKVQMNFKKQAQQNNLLITVFLTNATASMIQMVQVRHTVLCASCILSQCAELGEVHLYREQTEQVNSENENVRYFIL